MIVLDCSAAVNIATRTARGDALQSLFLPEEKIIAPDLFHAEAASAMGKYVRSSVLSQKEALEYLEDMIRLVDEFIPMKENYVEAFYESITLDHSVYDMLYLTLARRFRATLVSLDKRLIELCEEQGIDCIHTVQGGST